MQPLNNPNALGAAWTVNDIKVSPSADALLEELKTTDFSAEALVIENTFPKNLALKYNKDSLTTIELINSKPDKLIYEIQTQSKQFVVFSEMYYPHGWTATVNGKISPIVNVNYVLRGLEIPSGKSTIIFRFKPQLVSQGSQIRWGSLILFILFLGGIYYAKSRSQIQAV